MLARGFPGVQPSAGDALVARGRSTERVRMRAVERHLQRTDSPVLDIDVGFAADGSNPVVVEVEAANTQVQHRRSLVYFDVRREHSRRGLRGAGGDGTIVDCCAGEAADGEFPCDRAPDDAGAHDDNPSPCHVRTLAEIAESAEVLQVFFGLALRTLGEAVRDRRCKPYSNDVRVTSISRAWDAARCH